MFDIVLMTNTSPKNVLDKTVTNLATVSGVIRDGSDIINPTIEIEYGASPATVNYIYIGEFGRYYYVNDITSTHNGLWVLSCSSDPLMSFKSNIKNCTGILRRAENHEAYNVMLDDGSFRTYADPYIVTKNFPNGFSNPSYVLAVAGGSSSQSSGGSEDTGGGENV